MTRSSPWSVKGVDQDTRQIAREAAKRHGLTIGEWVDRAIKTRAENLEPATPIDTPSTIGAVQAPSTTESVPRIDEQPVTKPQADEAPARIDGISFNVEQALKSARGEEKKTSPKDIIESNLGTKPPQAEGATVITASTKPKIFQYSRIGLLGSAIIATLIGGAWIYDNNLSPTSSPPQQQASVVSKPSAPTAKSIVKTSKPKIAPIVTNVAKATADKALETSVATVTQRPAPASNETNDLDSLRRLANTGNHKAQFELANLFLSGKGVVKSPKQAVLWLKKAANGGVAPAQYNLGLLYETGSGVKKSPAAAIGWYRKAADKGHARAQHNLGTLYAQGKGIPKDYKQAAHWFKKGTENGLADSMHSLGLMYEHGLGVVKSGKTATAYYNKALSAGSAEAAKKLKQSKFAANKSATQTEIAKVISMTPAAGSPNAGGLNKVGIADM
jgi:TPR repeat protein